MTSQKEEVLPKNIIMVLEVLKKHSDGEREEGRLSLKEIRDLVKKEYRVEIGDRAVRDNIAALIKMGYDIECSKIERKKKNGKDNSIKHDYYLVREFEDSELHLLIDGLLFSKYIPYSQCKQLVKKLEGLSNIFFKSKIGLPEKHPENKQLFFNIEVLEKAIAQKKKVSFNFTEYGTDKKPHIIQQNSQDKEYIVSPYRLVVSNGRYYLLCAFDEGEQYHFRVELIRNIKLLEAPSRPRREIKDQNKKLSRFMAEHIYMYSGESGPVTFRADKKIITDIIDWFGTGVTFSEETENQVTVQVTVNYKAMLYWALQYGMSVEVLGPPSLRKSVAAAVQGMWGKYNRKKK
jgi:hypothetical protein